MRRYIIFILIGIFAFSANVHSQPVNLSSRLTTEKMVENRLLKAIEKYNEGEYESAKKILNIVLMDDDSNDAAWYYQSLIAIHDNDLDLAQESLKRAVELDPMNFWYRYRLAMIYAYTGSEEVAADMYEKMLTDFPKKSELYFEMVDLYVNLGDYEKALDTIYEIERVFGQTDSLTLMAYRILLALDRKEEAVEYLQKYNSRYSSPPVLVVLAETALEQYNESEALAYFDEALELDPTFPQAQLGKAEIYRMTLCYDEFFPALTEYIDNPLVTAGQKGDYLLAVMEKGDPKLLSTYALQMDALIERFVAVHAKAEKSYEVAGMYYFYTHRFDRAKQYFMEYVQEHPDSYEASAALVEFLMYVQDWEGLSREGMAAFSRFPEEPAFLEMACVGDYHLGDYGTVLARCAMLLEVIDDDDPRIVNTLSTIGDVCHLVGEKKTAYKSYDAALKIDPNNVYVLNNYAYYLSMEGRNLKKAYAMSLKTVEAEPDNATYLDTFGWILYLQGKAVEARPIFKNAMLHGGKDSAVILDHYAEVLYALGDHNMAFIYWNLALQKDNGDVPGLKEKVEARRQESKK